MENIYTSLLKKSKVKIMSYSFTQEDGKKRYTFTREGSGDITFTSETKIVKLDATLLDYDRLDGRDVDDLFDEHFILEYLYDDFSNYLSFTEDGKAKLEFFDGKLEIDKFLNITTVEGKQYINGLIVDLRREEDFTNAYVNGVEYEMPNCKKFAAEIANGADKEDEELRELLDEDEELRELLDEDEVRGLAEVFKSKVQAGADLIPQGLYVIVNNKIYYFTAEEYYDNIYYPLDYDGRAKVLNMIYDEGTRQLDAKLILNKTKALRTLSEIIKSETLKDKKYIDLNNEEVVGKNLEKLLEDLLSDNQETYELLESELKTKGKVK